VTDHDTLAEALVAALADLSVVEKGHTADAGSYSYDYADLADVVKLTRPKLAEHGIAALTPVHEYSEGLACTVRLLHTSGDEIEFPPLPFPHGRDAQATGSMITYHRRYALVAALGMAAGDDDDGASAAARAPTHIAKSDADHLRERLVSLPKDLQDEIKPMVKAGGRIETFTAEQLDEAHRFVTDLEDELSNEKVDA
jgi:hypothetical protein